MTTTTTIIMILIVIFMACELLIGMKTYDDPGRFFDITSTKALRGFWYIWLPLTHAPDFCANPIQDAITSFGYISITFFFMTSGYGLMLSYNKKPEQIHTFWRKRLPKLLLTNLIINVIGYIAVWVTGAREFEPWRILIPDPWLIWLMVCYLAFWLGAMIFGEKKTAARIFTYMAITVFSIVAYLLKKGGIIEATWETEVFGFIWGMILAVYGQTFYRYVKERWLAMTGVFCLISLALGLTYLKLKPVFFVGEYLTKIILGVAITLFILAVHVRYAFGNKVSLFLGGLTLELFLIHMFVFNVLEVLIGESIDPALFIVIGAVIPVILAYLCHLAIKPVIDAVMRMPFFSRKV
ncbi:MAG: acyltransferase family protein [Lachnospiraceae bacterium]|nr:acyltransferase family protein [Lachnospiraceae bacterium]